MVIGGRPPPASGQTFFFFAPLLIPVFILGVPLLDAIGPAGTGKTVNVSALALGGGCGEHRAHGLVGIHDQELETGDAFRKTGLLRQAMQQLERSRAMDADPVAPQLALAELYARCGLEQQAREIINNLRANLPASQTTNSWLDASLSLLEAASWQQSSNVVAMQNALQAALEKYPNDARTAGLAEQIYVSSGDYASALKLVRPSSPT